MPHTTSEQRLRPSQEPPFTLSPSSDFMERWESVVALLRGKSRICVLAGAGMSVSCGIPDFRSKGTGLYATLNAQELGLSCAEELFDIHFFDEDPRPFYRFARQLYFPLANGETTVEENPQRVLPSDSHKLLALLEQKKMLLRVYSQNIDGLEEEAGVSSKKVCYAHGSLQWASCRRCHRKVPARDFAPDILAGRVARCQVPNTTTTNAKKKQTITRVSSRKRTRESAASLVRSCGDEGVCGGVLKPGVTFFGETLQDNVTNKLEADRDKVDALVVIGTSLSVSPISKVIGFLPPNIPRILINRTIVAPPVSEEQSKDDEEETDFRDSYVFDAYLLGFCDSVVRALVRQLFAAAATTSDEPAPQGELLSTVIDEEDTMKDNSPFADTLEDWKTVTVPRERVFLFAGAQPPTGTSEEVKYHEVAQCDGCNCRIEGTIQKCQQCFDFDLCEACFVTVAPTHFGGQHSFAKETPVMARLCR